MGRLPERPPAVRVCKGWPMQDGQVSVTAQRVAAQRLTFDRVPAPYGDPAADDTLARDVAVAVSTEPGPLSGYLRARTRWANRPGRSWTKTKPGTRSQRLAGGSRTKPRRIRLAAPAAPVSSSPQPL